MNGATLVGYKEITSRKGEFTIAYVVYQPDGEGIGQACKDIFLQGHPLKEKMVGSAVNVFFDIGSGRVSKIEAA